MRLIRYSCGHISGPHEPIPTQFGLWMCFIMLHRYMYPKHWNPKKVFCDVIASVLCVVLPHYIIIMCAAMARAPSWTFKSWMLLRDHSKILVRGAWYKKILQNFFRAPLQTSQIFQGPHFAMKITGQPHRKACKLNFYLKICGNFLSRPLLQGSKILRPPFLHQAPQQVCVCVCVCVRSLFSVCLENLLSAYWYRIHSVCRA